MPRYAEFMDPEVPLDRDGVESQLASVCHPHLVEMYQERTSLLMSHAALHAMGLHESTAHEECLERLAQIDCDGQRAFLAIWS